MEVVNGAAVVTLRLIKDQAAILEQTVGEKAQENPRTHIDRACTGQSGITNFSTL